MCIMNIEIKFYNIYNEPINKQWVLEDIVSQLSKAQH